MGSNGMRSSAMSLVSSGTWTAHLSNTDGRDKATRVLQYSCKIARMSTNAKVVALASQMEGALSLARQVFRLGKWVNIIAKQHKFSDYESPAIEALIAVADLALFGYFILDNVTFLIRVGILKGNVKMMLSRAAKCWVISATSSLLVSCIRLWKLYTDKTDEARRDPVRLRRKKSAMLLSVIRFFMDDIIAVSLSLPEPLSPGLVGACGVVSSLVQSYNLWPKTLV